MRKILLVEDDPGLRGTLRWYLKSLGYDVVVFSSASRVLDSIADFSKVHTVLSDYEMPGLTGIELHNALLSRGFSGNFILMSGSISINESELRVVGINKFLEKPFTFADLNKMLNESVCSVAS